MKRVLVRPTGVRSRRGVAVGVLVVAWLAGGLGAQSALAQAQRTQSLRLDPGWNAVYLEVDPLVSDPAELFAGQAVDVVAAFTAAPASAQFVSNPKADLLGSYGWAVWYAPRRPDAFLSSLYGLNGDAAYLIHCATNVAVDVVGHIPLIQRKWVPNAYNFVGFSVLDPGAPTYGQFFAGSSAHRHNRIYRMVGGTWRQVLDPAAVAMRSGEAFWIYCDGHSDYPGPLEVGTSSQLGVVLSSQSGSDLVVRNRAPHPLSVAVDHLVDEGAPVPLSVAVQVLDTEVKALGTMLADLGPGGWTQNLPTLEAGKALRLPFVLRRSEMTPGARHSLLAVRSDLGTVSYVAVTASRDD